MILKVALTGITAVFLSVAIKNIHPPFSSVIALCFGIIVFGIVYKNLAYIINLISNLSTISGIRNENIRLLLKALGITYITEFTAASARDAGETAIATKIEFAGKLSVLLTSMPLFVSLIDMVTSLC